jgi:hypothetical protein
MTNPTTRSDAQLMVILDETAAWAVNGPLGRIVFTAASLRDAIEVAGEIVDPEERVSALTQRPDDVIIVVVRGQIDRLLAMIAGTSTVGRPQ